MNDADVISRDRLVAPAEKMLALRKDLAAAKTPYEKTALQRRIDTTDHEINSLVYQLYGLTEEEIAIIEKQ